MEPLIRDVQKNKEQWKKLRKGKIGASAAYDAADIDEGSNPLRVWSSLVADNEWEPQAESAWATWGLRLEPSIGKAFSEDYAKATGSEVKIVGGDALYQSEDFPFAVATPDFLMEINGELVNVQTKTRVGSRWSEYQEGIPNPDRAQVLHELGVLAPLGIRRAFLAVFFYPNFASGVPEPTLIWHEIKAEEEWISELFRREKRLFEMAQRREPPPIKVPGEYALSRFWESNESVLDLEGDDVFASCCELYKKASEIEKEAQETKKKAAGRLLERIQNGSGARTKGYKVTVVRREPSLVSLSLVQEKEPELYARLKKDFSQKSRSIYPLVTELGANKNGTKV